MMVSAVLVSTLRSEINSINFLPFDVQVIVVGLLLYVRCAEGICTVCGGESGAACMTTTTFKPCFLGQTFSSRLSCANY